MALTNYRAYKWLIFLLDQAPDQVFGMTLEKINKYYQLQRREIYNHDIDTSARTREGLEKAEDQKPLINDDYAPTYKDTYKEYVSYAKKDFISYKTFLNWRNAIWKAFGLIIWHPVVKGVAKNSYILVNRELLDTNKTLRETIIHLADDEQRGYQNDSPFTTSNRGRKKIVQPADLSMGFISVDNDNSYVHYQEESNMVDIIQFAMTIGEGLVVKHITHKGAIPEHSNKNDRFVFEPQQLIHVNDRWYAAGDLYEYGDKETKKVIVCDVERLRLSEDEDVVPPRYTIKEGFNIYNQSPSDWTEHFNPGKVVSMYLKVCGNIFDKTPFCQAQEKVDIYVGVLNHIYKVWLKPDINFYLQYMSYGDEVRVIDTPQGVERTALDISNDQITYLKKLRKQEANR